jgi:hypothetical protein
MPDFSDWTVRDDDSVLTIEGDKISWHKADRTAVRYIGKQHNVPDDFVHEFVVCFLEGEVEDEENRGFIRLWEVRNDWKNRAWVYARKNGDCWTIYLEQLNKRVRVMAFEGSARLLFGSRYTVKISRDWGDYRIVVIDGEGLTVEDSGNVSGVFQGYSQVWLASTIKSRRNNGNWSTGYIENLSLMSEKI